MDGTVVVRNLGVNAHCGVTPDEREVEQTLMIDAELTYDTTTAIAHDDIGSAVDYEQVCRTIIDVARTEHCALLETLAQRMLDHLFERGGAREIFLRLQKRNRPAAMKTQGSVGVEIRAQRPESPDNDQPSTLLAEYLSSLPRGRALDVAAGRGRNTVFLATQGFQVEAVDRDREAIAACRQKVETLGLSNVTIRHVDLEQSPALGSNTYDLIVNTYYLQRDLAPAIREALTPGGYVIFETFLIENHHRFGHPRRKEFCLESNELLRLFDGMSVLYYREGLAKEGPYLARLVAVKR